MAVYVFLPQEIIEDGDEIGATACEVDGINGGGLHRELHDLATEWADYHDEPVTCFRLVPVSWNLTNVPTREEQAEARADHEYDRKREDAL